MNIYLGNLTTRQIEERLEITLTDDERKELEECRENKCDDVTGNDVWHCYDFPFVMVCGSPNVADKIYKILSPYSDKMRGQLRVSADYGNEVTE